MLVIAVALFVMVVGLFIWFAASNPKVSEAGKILFACGALALTLQFSGEVIGFGSRGR